MTNCNVCNSRIRKTTYNLYYIGNVCSKCFRMSKEKYCEVVEIISLKKIQFILEEILKDKEKYLIN